MAGKKKVNIFIDPETYEQIRELSRLLGVSVPKLLTEASSLLMKRYEKVISRRRATAEKQKAEAK